MNENVDQDSTWKPPSPHGNHDFKKTISVYLPRNLVEAAKLQGLNLSRTLENALTIILSQNIDGNTETPSFLMNVLSKKKIQWTGRDLNPRLPPCEGGDHARLIYRPDFGKEALLKELLWLSGFIRTDLFLFGHPSVLRNENRST